MSNFSSKSSLGVFAVALAASLSIFSANNALAATTSAEIIAKIDKEHILAPGGRVNAQVDGTSVKLSTYRHVKANEQDLKIDAMLMAKAVTDLDPSINTITVSYFDQTDLNKYRQVTVTSVAIKAFGAGAVGKDEVISSLALTSGTSSDAQARLTNVMESKGDASNRHIKSSIQGDEIQISAEADPDDSDTDLKIAAFQFSKDALQASPSAKNVTVAFNDPASPGTAKVLKLGSDTVQSLSSAIEKVLSPLSVTTKASAGGAGGGVTVAPGYMLDDRKKLLARIQTLGKEGVGITGYMTAFADIENRVISNAANDQIADAVARLSSGISEQEKHLQEAKSKKTTAAKGGGGEPKMPRQALNPWVIQTEPLQTGTILEHPSEYADIIQQKVYAQAISPREKDERYMRAMQFFVQTLQSAPGKSAELATIKSRLFAFQRSHAGLNFD